MMLTVTDLTMAGCTDFGGTLASSCWPAGAKTGRCPRDKRVVRDPATEKDIW